VEVEQKGEGGCFWFFFCLERTPTLLRKQTVDKAPSGKLKGKKSISSTGEKGGTSEEEDGEEEIRT